MVREKNQIYKFRGSCCIVNLNSLVFQLSSWKTEHVLNGNNVTTSFYSVIVRYFFVRILLVKHVSSDLLPLFVPSPNHWLHSFLFSTYPGNLFSPSPYLLCLSTFLFSGDSTPLSSLSISSDLIASRVHTILSDQARCYGLFNIV